MLITQLTSQPPGEDLPLVATKPLSLANDSFLPDTTALHTGATRPTVITANDLAIHEAFAGAFILTKVQPKPVASPVALALIRLILSFEETDG